ncbi:hypothetical protein JRQ81_015373 [Phrynocephalus forsythii]|uniref:USP domain-containing protein n=1 Tax=Phrynocephalus forsythii TaxID=171643 RepID=A0A9Q0XUV4_9SAUR|nr:hypothetical protein JRQ81_015373 [Phrynocephalus forsythii]
MQCIFCFFLVFILYDASQLFLILWNLIKDQITSPELAEHLTRLYSIQLQENTVCQECFLETKKDSNMLMLPLPMFDFDSQPLRTLEDALHLFFAPVLLTEKNTFHCEQCVKKTSCLRVRVTKKVSHSLSFPPSLDFSQILTPEHYCPDTQEKDNGLYDLFAVVAHSGLADFGHYCAYVWSLTEHKWFCFNDSSVCQVSWEDVKCTYGRSSLRWGETAYLLVYLKRNCKQL